MNAHPRHIAKLGSCSRLKSVLGFAIVFSLCLASSIAGSATLSGDVTFGSPDQPWGRRRPVTDADRVAVQSYRSGRKSPQYATTFGSAAEFAANWSPVEDDDRDATSCRRSANDETSGARLRLKTLVATGCRHPWSTGYVASKAKFGYGFYEATLKIADISGLNNAFWLTTDDDFEIDITEARYPSYDHIGLQHWPHNTGETHAGVGWGANFKENLAYGFHDFGMLWTPTDMVFEVDGEPVAAAVTDHAVKGPAVVRLSTALGSWAGKLVSHPEGHNMVVKSLRIFDFVAATRFLFFGARLPFG